MDKLAKRLREDAQQIDGTVSEELDDRIRASLQGVSPQDPDKPEAESKPAWFWWVSSLTGVAAAAVIIAVNNLQAPEPAPTVAESVTAPLVLPGIEWHTKPAVLTRPLEQEIDDLQSDLKKAEAAVKQDIDRLF